MLASSKLADILVHRRASMRGLKGRTVLVTGGASGIGQATAARFLEEGCAVCVLDRDAEARERVAAELPALTAVIDADVSNLEQVQAAIGEAIGRMGALDVLINNAGISIRHDFLDITPEEWDEVLDVNLKGIFQVAQTAARHMVARGSGVILNTASTGGSTGYPHYADYCASKGGVIALTQAMALELAPIVRVAAVSPGYVLTPMQRAEYTDAMLDAVNGKIPFGRHGRPEEIAGLFAFLASDDASFASGHVYVMDGAETTGGLCSQWTHE
jgi:NAD(P)-dependent dehydrogenase (short-subunit alcohol dehydrogenase family)